MKIDPEEISRGEWRNIILFVMVCVLYMVIVATAILALLRYLI